MKRFFFLINVCKFLMWIKLPQYFYGENIKEEVINIGK